MHPVSTSFNQIPENKLVADTFAIVMGSTHCEPLLLNTASEWDTQTMGPWNYDKNKEGINRVLTQRVRENSPYENVYTLALRGLHDGAMSTTLPMHEKVRMLQQALLDQRPRTSTARSRPSRRRSHPTRRCWRSIPTGWNCPTTSRSSGRTTTTAT